MNMEPEVSFVELAKQLSRQQLKILPKEPSFKSAVSHAAKLSRMKQRLYETLFSHLKGPHIGEPLGTTGTPYSNLNVENQLYCAVYDLRLARKFDDANKLEGLLNKYFGQQSSNIQLAICKLLLCLKDSVTKSDCSITKVPLVHPDKTLPCVIPTDCLAYGDTRLYAANNSQWFLHYSPETFSLKSEEVSLENSASLMSRLQLEPGESMKTCRTFSTFDQTKDKFRISAERSLFSGLHQSHVRSVNVKLDIPDLSSDSMPGIHIPKFWKSKDEEDEGFAERFSLSGSHNDVSFASGTSGISDDDNIWDKALKIKPSRHYVWEKVGCLPRVTEQPYLSEAGPANFDQFLQEYMKILCMVQPELVIPIRREISMEQLVLDVHNLLLGLPSETFVLDEQSQTFRFVHGTFVSGMSTAGVCEAVQDFVDCATSYWHLRKFSNATTTSPESGLVFQAFCTALHTYLNQYCLTLLSVHPGNTLMKLRDLLHETLEQMRFIAKLCMCTSSCPDLSETGSPMNDDQFPTGIQLLSYLYERTTSMASSCHYPVLLAFLKTSCQPYMKLVSDWVFDGHCSDLYKEFMVRVDQNAMCCQDRRFWCEAYTIQTQEDTEGVPAFMSELANDLYVCGKTINLLRLCDRQNYLFTTDKEPPAITVTFSETELAAGEVQASVYATLMMAVARQHTRSVKHMEERARKAKEEVVAKARKAIHDEMKEYDRQKLEMRKLEAEKKKVLLNELKEQMAKDVRRKAEEQEKEKEMDVELLRVATEKGEEDAKLEEMAREELIAYYEQLTEQAALREERALWRVRRHQLNARRREFFESELTELQQSLSQIDMADLALSVMPEGELASEFKFDEAADQSVLPKWAQNATQLSGKDVPDDDSGMPKWAKRAAGLPSLRSPQSGTLHDKQDVQLLLDGHDGSFSSDSASPRKKWSGASPEKRTNVKLVDGRHVSTESDLEQDTFVPSIKLQESVDALTESEMPTEAFHVKTVEDQHASKESCPDDKQVSHIKLVPEMSATAESEETEEQSVIKIVDGKHVSSETDELERRSRIKAVEDRQVNIESTPAEPWVVKPSVFGHVSEQSQGEIDIPKLGKIPAKHASKESTQYDVDFFGYQIKPSRRRKVKGQEVNMQSQEVEKKLKVKPHEQHVSMESEHLDPDQVRLQKFKDRNVKGHASDSTISRMIYNRDLGTVFEETGEGSPDAPERSEFSLQKNVEVEPYHTSWDFSKKLVIASSQPKVSGSRLVQPLDYYKGLLGGESDGHNCLSLSSVLRRCITLPLMAQVSVVNDCVINYYMVDLKIKEHFAALRQYFFLEDGEFGQTLSARLCEKLATSRSASAVLNPVFLNTSLSKALLSSVRNSVYSQQLSFVIKSANTNSVLDCLQLVYHVDWPLNIVITEECLVKYGAVFNFMLSLKRTSWTLHDIWHRLKRDILIKGVGSSRQLSRLHQFHHEMEHFVQVMQGYLSHQVIEGTWHMFCKSLQQDIHDLDSLYQAHTQYLDSCVSRCLVDKRAEPVMKIISVILALTLKFRTLLISQTWQINSDDGEVSHPKFDQLSDVYKSFNEYSHFLFKVVNNIVKKRYQPHLAELLLRLNFNGFYMSDC